MSDDFTPAVHRIVLNDEQWNELMELIDSAPRDTPKLRALLLNPTIFDQEV